MTARLFCEHCDKFYEVDIDDVRCIMQYQAEDVTFAHNTYFFKDGCFFQTLKRLKQDLHEG